MATREHLVRALWTVFEPIHAVTYFSAQARTAFADVGLPRYWDGYFAGRAAPLGPVGAAPVIAIFSGFAPMLVNRALPSVWAVASPQQVIEARYVGAVATLRDLVADEAAVLAAATALVPIAASVDTIGRPLAAANAALALEDDPYRRLWQAAATLREHRGDGHVIALVSLGVAGIATLVLRSGVDLDAASLQKARGWTDDEWAAAVDEQCERGLLDAHGRITAEGAATLAEAERLTNALAVGPWAASSDDELREIARTLLPVATAVGEMFPYPNPIGMPVPWNPDLDPDALAIPEAPAQ